MDGKRRVILDMGVRRRLILYMRTYISTHTKLFPLIDQVYQKISLENPIQLQLTAQVSNFLTGKYTHIPLSDTC